MPKHDIHTLHVHTLYAFGAKSADSIKTKDATITADVNESGGTVCGYAATFNREPDTYGDIIAKGAFLDTLAHWEELNGEGKRIPLLYAHNMGDPAYNIGYVTLAKEDDHGLYVEAVFDADNEKAQYVRKLVKEGRLYQFSFSYHILEASNVQLSENVSAYELRKLELLEVSLVQVPANRHAVVTEIKSAKVEQKSGRRNSKADEDELRSVLGKLDEVRSSIISLIGDEEDDEEDDGVKDDSSAEEKDDANDANVGAAEGDEGVVESKDDATPEGHEVDDAMRVEAYKAAMLAALSKKANE